MFSRFHGYSATNMLYWRIQFTGSEEEKIEKILPRFGRMMENDIDHVNFSRHQFDTNDVHKLETVMSGVDEKPLSKITFFLVKKQIQLKANILGQIRALCFEL